MVRHLFQQLNQSVLISLNSIDINSSHIIQIEAPKIKLKRNINKIKQNRTQEKDKSMTCGDALVCHLKQNTRKWVIWVLLLDRCQSFVGGTLRAVSTKIQLNNIGGLRHGAAVTWPHNVRSEWVHRFKFKSLFEWRAPLSKIGSSSSPECSFQRAICLKEEEERKKKEKKMNETKQISAYLRKVERNVQ